LTRRWAAPPLIVGAVAAALLLVAAAPAPAASPDRDRACGWILEPTADPENILFPEIQTRYLGAVVTSPPGGYVEITGQFPHGRYMSLQTYTTTLQSISTIRDEQIVPDPGSRNPFVPGANRNVRNRSYTVRLVHGQVPAGGPAPNTIYDTNASGQTGFGLAYSLYLPDRNEKPFGGVPPPALAIVTASGQRIPLPTCPDPLTDVGLTQVLAGAGLADLELPPAGLLATRVPVWHRYVNAPSTYATGLTDGNVVPPQLADRLTSIAGRLPSGLGENSDNKYVYAYLSREFGSVAMIHVKVPTTPHTFDGESRMGAGQLRYWSLCSGNRLTIAYGCQVDEQLRLDRRRYATIAVSTAADRPANASRRCGIEWIPWGPDPKGIVAIRNMLPSPSFHHAIQNSTPGTERETMGPYYPRVTYFATPGDVERHYGC
jgi:hypothetical protein